MVVEHVEVIVVRIDDYLLQGLALVAQVLNPFSHLHLAAQKDHEGAGVGRAYVQQLLTFVQFKISHSLF